MKNNAVILLCAFLIFNFACSQKQNPNKLKFIGKTFKGNIGGMCAETIPPDPCAGYTTFLYIKFEENYAQVSEQNVSCDKIVGKIEFKTKWEAKGNTINIEKLTRYGQPFKIDSLVYKNGTLVGTEINWNDSPIEYTFDEVKK